MKNTLTTLLIIAEPLLLLLLIYTFWFHSPPIRDQWVWLLWFAVPIFWLRLRITGRLWQPTPLDNLLVVFILLTACNFATAPFARANYLVLLCRPLLGIWLYIYFCEYALMYRTLKWLVIATVGMGFVLAIVSLTTTNWETGKSGDLAFIINALPRLDWRLLNGTFSIPFLRQELFFPPISEMGLAFNPNEVAGALAYMIPVLAAFAIGNPKTDAANPVQKRLWTGVRVVAAVALVFALLSLIIGQSRFAIAGVLGALVIVVWLLVENRIWKIALLSGVAVIVLFQVALLFNLFTPTPTDTIGISSRDQNTFSTRFDLWSSAARMMFDYPLTGTGMSMFRTAVNQEAYQIEYYVQRGTTPPHAHNEWLQMGADLGIPGFLTFLTMQAVILWMLWKGWRASHPIGQIVAVAVFGGLVAHSIYGLGDAITMWDRFSFVMWWLVGLTGAQYVLATHHNADTDTSVGKVSEQTISE